MNDLSGMINVLLVIASCGTVLSLCLIVSQMLREFIHKNRRNHERCEALRERIALRWPDSDVIISTMICPNGGEIFAFDLSLGGRKHFIFVEAHDFTKTDDQIMLQLEELARR